EDRWDLEVVDEVVRRPHGIRRLVAADDDDRSRGLARGCWNADSDVAPLLDRQLQGVLHARVARRRRKAGTEDNGIGTRDVLGFLHYRCAILGHERYADVVGLPALVRRGRKRIDALLVRRAVDQRVYLGPAAVSAIAEHERALASEEPEHHGEQDWK